MQPKKRITKLLGWNSLADLTKPIQFEIHKYREIGYVAIGNDSLYSCVPEKPRHTVEPLCLGEFYKQVHALRCSMRSSVSSHKQEPAVTGGCHLWLGLVSLPSWQVCQHGCLGWLQPRARSAASAQRGRARGASALQTPTLSQTEHPRESRILPSCEPPYGCLSFEPAVTQR